LDPNCEGGVPEFADRFNQPQEIGTPLDVFCYGLIAYSVLTEEVVSGDALDRDISEIPPPFQTLLGRCWSENPRERPDFASIVTQFLKAGLALSMDPVEEAKAKNYQTRVLSPSYALNSVVDALDQIQAIVRSNSRLQNEVERLTRNIEGLCRSITSYEVGSSDASMGVGRPWREFLGSQPPPTFPTALGGHFPVRPSFSETGGEASRVRLARPKFSYTPIDMRRMSMKLAVLGPVATPGASDARLPEPANRPQLRRNSMMPPIPQLSLEARGGPRMSTDWSGIPRLRLPNAFKQAAPSSGRISGSSSRPAHLTIQRHFSGLFPVMSKSVPTAASPPARQGYAICAFLTSKNQGQNIASTGVVTITGNSIDPPRECLLPWLVHRGWTKCWTSENTPESWVQFDFHEKRLLVTHYEIKTYPSGPGYSHLKSWVLRGKVGPNRWVDLDRRNETVDLNGKSNRGTFFLEIPAQVTAIKLIQTEPNHAGDHYLILTNVEFYGEIMEGA
jgi:hypothetical protein